MFHVEAVIDGPIDGQNPVRLAQRALLLLGQHKDWTVRLVKAQSRQGQHFLDATQAEVMHAKAILDELDGDREKDLQPVSLLLARELKRLNDDPEDTPHPRMVAIAEGVIASAELGELAELGNRGEITGTATLDTAEGEGRR